MRKASVSMAKSLRLFANPYDISAVGFYFSSHDEYRQKAAKLRNSMGFPVEEFEIEFMDGEEIDVQLFQALKPHPGNLGAFIVAVEDWTEEDKVKVICAVGYSGYAFKLGEDAPDSIDVELYELDSVRALAEQFVDEGYYGEIPDRIANFLDYDAIANELHLGDGYDEITIAGKHYVYRCE